MRRAERERLDQGREAVRVAGEAEIRGHIRGTPRPGLIPGDNRELVGQGGELRSPHAAVLGDAVHEHERRPLADVLVGDLEPVRPDDLHRRDLHARRGQVGSTDASLLHRTKTSCSGALRRTPHPRPRECWALRLEPSPLCGSAGERMAVPVAEETLTSGVVEGSGSRSRSGDVGRDGDRAASVRGSVARKGSTV